MSVSAMLFLLEIMFISKAIKSHFKESYDKQNLTLVVSSYEIYETHVRSCISAVVGKRGRPLFHLCVVISVLNVI